MPAKIQNPFSERVAYVYPSGCHEWIGKKQNDGYGLLRDELVHRIALSWVYGPVSDGWYVDHECRNRRCVNVRHLRVVTPAENGLENSESPRAKLAKRTHCPRGHKFGERVLQANGTYRRRCKICYDEYHAAYRLRKRNAAR